MTNSIKHIGDKLVVGQLDVSFISASARLFPGTSVLNGPVYIGLVASPVATAGCMIGPPIGISVPASLEVKGISNIFGVVNVTGTINRIAITNASGATIKTGISIKKALAASLGLSTKAGTQITAGAKVCNSVVNTPWVKAEQVTCVTITAQFGQFSNVDAPFKKFNIPHPTKPQYRLIHACIEGPEIGVYYRGKLKGSNYIDLPDYWRNLVDVESITVNLTPHGNYQELYYEITNWGTKIKVLNNSGSNIDCSYIVYAERKDVDKLIIEKEDRNGDIN